MPALEVLAISRLCRPRPRALLPFVGVDRQLPRALGEREDRFARVLFDRVAQGEADARLATGASASNAVPAREDRPLPSADTSTVRIAERPIAFKVEPPERVDCWLRNRNPPRPSGRFRSLSPGRLSQLESRLG